jgi:hypothetical protein
MTASRPLFVSVAAAIVLVALGVGAVRLSGPPAPLGDDSPETTFSAERAMVHVRALAQNPHPMGSAEHGRVRTWLVSELQKLGFTVARQRTTAVGVHGEATRPRGTVPVGLVDNVMVRLPGTASSGVVLVAAHYDSAPVSPGGADDGAAVAAMLETLRAIKTLGPLRNDVVALFTDGEEDGLLGAKAFVSHHPWAREVRVVLNFEARGNRGAVQLFETTAGNGPIAAAWMKSVPKPAGTSLAYEVYRRLPNDTDFTEFKRMNAVGLNFAFIDHVDSYHTPLDSAAALDRGSLQGVGETMLSLTRHFGGQDLELANWRRSDAVFSSLPGGYAVRYPTMLAVPLVVVGIALWVWALARAKRRGDASFWGSVGAVVVFAVLAGGELWASLRVGGWIESLQNRWNPIAEPFTNGAYALAVVLAAIVCWLAACLLMRRKLAPNSLALAGAFLGLAVSAVLAWFVPGASYVAIWPTLAAILAIAVLPGSNKSRPTGWGPVLAIVALAIPAMAILAPTGTLLFRAMGLGPQGAVATVSVVVLGLITLLPQIEIVIDGQRWWAVWLTLLLGVGMLAAGAQTSPYSAFAPRPENLVYAMNADAKRAVWATTADPSGPWLEQFVTADPKRGPLAGFTSVGGQTPFLSHEAPAIDVPGPEIVLQQSTNDGGGRLLAVHVTSPRQARRVSVRIPEREIHETIVNGQSLTNRPGPQVWAAGRWGLEFSNIPPEGFDLVVRVKGTTPVTFVVADRSEGVPESLLVGTKPRPASSMPAFRGDLTVVQRMFTF